jgi:hypothetical protein
MVFHDRAVYQVEHAAQLIMARRISLQPKADTFAQICRSPFAFPLQAGGGPYISRNIDLQNDARTLNECVALFAPTDIVWPQSSDEANLRQQLLS